MISYKKRMKVHFIAIGGSAMHNLALAMHHKGYKVTGSDDEIATAMMACIASKLEGHEINTSRFVQPDRPMYSIGG